MRVAELYRSIQGEGRLTGTESIFVRASGCNLRCTYCDTPFASWNPEGADVAVDDLAERIVEMAAVPCEETVLGVPRDSFGPEPSKSCRHVVLTGGEPMLFAELIPLCERLRNEGLHITIETAGTLYLPLACDLMSISPKTANSTPDANEYPKWHARHERTRHAPDVIRRLVTEYTYQLKFVVSEPRDLDEIEAWLEEFPEIDWENVLMMPEGVNRVRLESIASWLQSRCQQLGFGFCPRRHIEWFGTSRQT